MSTFYTRLTLMCVTLLCLAPAMAYTSSDCDTAEELVDMDILADRGDCRDYNLDRTITRQEVAAIALKVAESCDTIRNIEDLDDYRCENIYEDVSRNYPNSWACRAIEILSDEGIFTQSREDRYGDRYFRPLRSITRAESLAVMLDAADLDFRRTIYDNWRFTGTGAVSWQKPLMQYADDENIITSISSFRPNQSAYRKDVFNYAQEALNMCDGDYINDDDDDYYDDDYCGIGQRYSGGRCVSCTTKPSNSRYDERGSCDWTCSSGYRKSGSKCVWDDDYDDNNDDDCDKGEYESNNRCYACNSKPSNSKYTTYGSCSWTCNSGYRKSGSSCVRETNDYCGVGEYNSGNGCYTCNTKPSNAYYTTNGSCSWTCNSGYRKSGNVCIRDYDDGYNNCSVGQYTSGSGNTCYSCDNRPSNAYYTTRGSCDWTCDSGYYRDGNSCRSTYGNDNYYYWYTSSWSSCSYPHSNASGSRWRTVECHTTGGTTVADWNCTDSRPASDVSC